MKHIKDKISFLEPELVSQIVEVSSVKKILRGTKILKEGQYIKVLPIVLKGLVKVFSRFKDRELLLYYIRPNQSCVMSLSASLNNEPSRIFAITEEDSEILFIPVDKMLNWLKNFPRLNNLFYQQYNLRYIDLLDTIHHILLDKMDKRLFDFLKKKTKLTKSESLKITHTQIASELGTVREVISRVMKKLEIEGKIIQEPDGIKILKW